MRPRAALAALLLALPGWAAEPSGTASAAPSDGRPEAIPAGIPVTLDGTASPAEWDDAATALLSPAGPRLYLKQCRGTLLVAVTSDRPWPRDGRFAFYTHPGPEEGPYDAPGSLQLDFEPFQHGRPHALTTEKPAGATTFVDRHGVWVVRAVAHGERASLEAAAPLAALGIGGKNPPWLRWLAAWITPGTAESVHTVPAGVELRGPLGKTPPGLASTIAWGNASTWVEPEGAGAFSKADWSAFLAADRDLEDRGVRAHAMAVALMDPTRGEEPKVDEPIERDLLGALRWIADREPWTRGDVRDVAVGLQRLNRLDEAIATLGDAGSIAHPAADRGLDLYVLAQVANDAERYEDSARAWDRTADLVGSESQAGPLRREAQTARATAALRDVERAARAADAAKDDQPLVRLKTSRGDVLLRLLEDDAPESVAQFVALCDEKTKDGKPFFSGLLWHRVFANGLAQTGDPTSREGCAAAGAGGSTWFVDPERPAKPRRFFRGSVGFAIDRMNHVRSQFFVVTARKAWLDPDAKGRGGYPCFATVIAGMDVIDRLQACDALIGVDVLRRRPHPYEPKKKY